MIKKDILLNKFVKQTLSCFVFISCPLLADQPPIIQPNIPGIESKNLTPEQATDIANTLYTSADVNFMQGMIIHHNQAIVMSNLVDGRTNSQAIIDLAGRIKVSQDDEINFMENWLKERDEMTHSRHHAHHSMKGMATKEQLEKLAASLGNSFDQLFLELMVAHHDGAIEMVSELSKFRGAAYDPVMNEFVSDLVNDQAVEIERMNILLTEISADPRAGLAGGLYHADEAILNLELVASLKKPVGFFDPNNLTERNAEDLSDDSDEVKSTEMASRGRRSPMLSFSNTDMAFQNNFLIAGNYHGFNIYDISKKDKPELLVSVVCPGGQGDISIVENLLIMSVEETRGRVDCGLEGINSEPNPVRFRGLRIFDISNIKNPQQVGLVQTCRGSHTHSVVNQRTNDGKILVYNSGTSSVRDEEELEQCIGNVAGDNRTALFRIDIIEIPIENPEDSKIVSSPTVFADELTGALGGLWTGGDHGDDTQDTSRTDECHDITIFPTKKIAAGACSGNGILFDISDPYNPKRLDVVSDKGFAYWHSATFNNDGSKVLFTDEWGGGGRPRCRAWDPLNWGADAIYDIKDQKLVFQSHYKMPAPQLETENCVAHNGSIIPIPDRDIFVQAWYQGGISVMDFTDSSNPVEIGYFDRGPISEDELITGGYWSAYYYEGYIYATEITRGLDVFKLLPSQFLSEDEIDAASKALPVQGPQRLFNPQQQIPLVSKN
ncbi:MAG: DUF305 domain-containing protein [Pseudomonadota bacterium]|nr:DUF305 domain-containing protein [Pseudomonadota bacterium]